MTRREQNQNNPNRCPCINYVSDLCPGMTEPK